MDTQNELQAENDDLATDKDVLRHMVEGLKGMLETALPFLVSDDKLHRLTVDYINAAGLILNATESAAYVSEES